MLFITGKPNDNKIVLVLWTPHCKDYKSFADLQILVVAQYARRLEVYIENPFS